MNFLQPLMLFALPVIVLPILIHLINQRRYRTIQWAAMMFLLAANRMSRGYARIRQWLILAARTLAIAGLIFAISRPLTSGWLSLAAGGRPDSTLILLDRSPSMQQQGLQGKSKLASALDQLTSSLHLIGSQHWVLIDSADETPVEFESLEELPRLVQTSGVSSAADLPEMLQSALKYLQENRVGRSELWVCSDVRQNDWDAESGRWSALRDAFLALPQPVRIHLLSYAEPAPLNRSIRVTDVRRQETSSGGELLISLQISQIQPIEGEATIPVQLEIDGARSELPVLLQGNEVELRDHAVPLNPQQLKGWGRVSIPADENPADNQFYFVYDQPVSRKTLIICEDPEATRPLQLAAAINPEADVEAGIELFSPDDLTGAEWETASLVLWQAALPADAAAEQLLVFLERGGQVIFFPPPSPTSTEFAGVRWGAWSDLAEDLAVMTWVGDQDVLAHTKSGTALPVGQLKVSRYCTLEGEFVPLASLSGDAPLLARAVTAHRNIYFCATTAAAKDSSLAQDGVVFYIMIQRALAAGAASLGGARQYLAGHVPGSATDSWKRLAGETDALSSTYAQQAGVYQRGDQLLAVNRSPAEDLSKVLSTEKVAGLFDRLPFDRVDEQAGAGNALLAEVWRLFLGLMLAALLVEACLCLPRIGPSVATPSTAGFQPPADVPATQGVPV